MVSFRSVLLNTSVVAVPSAGVANGEITIGPMKEIAGHGKNGFGMND